MPGRRRGEKRMIRIAAMSPCKRSWPRWVVAILLAGAACQRGTQTANPDDTAEASAARPSDPVDAAAQRMAAGDAAGALAIVDEDRKSTRLNSSHVKIS